MSGTYCPKCPCDGCERARSWIKDDGRPVVVPVIQNTGLGEPECQFDRIAREYKARGEPMPTGWLLYCPCKRCNPITF